MSVATLASGHVVATRANAPIMEYAWGEADWRGELVGHAERIDNGHLVIPDTPGLGLELDEDLVARHEGARGVEPLDPTLFS